MSRGCIGCEESDDGALIDILKPVTARLLGEPRALGTQVADLLLDCREIALDGVVNHRLRPHAG